MYTTIWGSLILWAEGPITFTRETISSAGHYKHFFFSVTEWNWYENHGRVYWSIKLPQLNPTNISKVLWTYPQWMYLNIINFIAGWERKKEKNCLIFAWWAYKIHLSWDYLKRNPKSEIEWIWSIMSI